MNLPLVIGVGSPHGDDRAGWLVIDCLKTLSYPPARLLSVDHPARLLDLCGEETSLIICDACSDDRKGGTADHFIWEDKTIAYQRPFTAHDLGASEAIQLLRRLSSPCPLIEVWTITGTCWEDNATTGTDVQQAAKRVASAIARKFLNSDHDSDMQKSGRTTMDDQPCVECGHSRG